MLVLTTALMLTSISSCKEDREEEKQANEIAQTSVNFQSTSSSKTIAVKTGVSNWYAKSPVSWCTARVQGRSLKISVDENEATEVRKTTVKVYFGTEVKEVKVQQLGTGAQILIGEQFIYAPAEGKEITVSVTANVAYTFELPEWIVKSEARATMKESTHKFTIKKNTETKTRNAKIVVVQKGVEANKAVKKIISVSQKGVSNEYKPVLPDFGTDTQIQIVSGKASQQNSANESIEKSFDGNKATIYHSPWGNGTRFPVTLTYNFAKVEDVDYFIYTPRSGQTNGNFEKVDVEYSTDGSSYTKIDTYDFNGSSSARKIVFKKTIKAKHIRFKVNSGVNNFASCAEMEFFTKTSASFDGSKLFTDPLCYKLKDGVTEKDIKACSSSFMANLAQAIYDGKYNTEFRVAEFKAYPDPAIQANMNKTNAYSYRENPTGIFVDTGDDLIVFVGDTHGYNGLSLQVQGLYPNSGKTKEAEGYGYGGQSYSLNEGLNQLKIEKKGLVYVNYYVNSLSKVETAQPIKIHFASGKVNGYFDSQNPKHEGRFRELLNNAVDDTFDVIGKYAHLTFPTHVFKQVTSDGKLLIDNWDKIVRNEMELLGLYKYNRVFKNHMYCNVAYHSFMYATWGHTAYSYPTNKNILNPKSFEPSGSVWGPGHEIGHMNQTRPQVKWIGMTEVTNNIMSEYITASVFKQKSRLQTESLGEMNGNNRYTKAWNSLITLELPLPILSIDPVKEVSKLPAKYKAGSSAKSGLVKDVFCQLVPFWQLQLYFGNVKGMTPTEANGYDGFYPRVYEWARTHGYMGSLPAGDQQGVYQTDFAYNASKASGYDLTDFFVKWGFLRELPKTEIDDYGKAFICIPQSRLDEVKKRIKDLNLKKITQPIEYISDRSVKFFKNNLHVVKGAKASWSGDNLVINGWKNVVAYEIWDKAYGTDGAKLLYVGDGYNGGATYRASCMKVKEFIRNAGGNPDGTLYLYAVDVNNDRILVEFN